MMNELFPTFRRIPERACALAIALVMSGCSNEPLQLDSNLNGHLDGELRTTVKIDGPLQLQMQGPSIRYEGTFVSDELLARVKVGTTQSDWLLAVLGQPDARSTLRNGSEIWRWTYKPSEQTGSLISIFNPKEKEPTLATRTVFIELREGTVADKWGG